MTPNLDILFGHFSFDFHLPKFSISSPKSQKTLKNAVSVLSAFSRTVVVEVVKMVVRSSPPPRKKMTHNLGYIIAKNFTNNYQIC